MRRIKFILESVKHPKWTGACCQSSKGLARKMAQKIENSKNVIEFGPGAGIITHEILNHLPEDGRLTCFEINPVFCKHLKTINDPRLTVINDDALNCRKYIDDYDCVVSGLPLTVFTKPQRENIIAISSRSKKYIQFQYTPFLQRKLKNHFTDVKLDFIPMNVPPAFIYVCSNSAE
ncbi:MAG: methyltransferase domain-containing protein [Planctomycetes bacterium]|nr:methyltransferase domain-containing protein [Planctomycetota bacterium]